MNNDRKMRVWERLGLAALAALTIFFLATSWRKWPDPLVDFGRELYVPWRLANGALLYRDAEDIYGPLSQYLNAGLFVVFGPGLMVLVAANLAVFAAILASIYLLLRQAWGAGAALASGAVFVSVFGFSQFLSIGNYNFATPYSHEATHGLLVCLGLAMVLGRWVGRATPGLSAAAGGLLGLTLVLKPEAMLAGAAITAAALALHLADRRALRPAAAAAWAAGALLPTAAFTVFFSFHVPVKTAAAFACRGWLSAAGGAGFTQLPLQAVFLGFDKPWQNVRGALGATGLALLLFAGIGGMAWIADRASRAWLRWGTGGALAAGVLWLAWFKIDWINTGRCLLGLTLVYIVWTAAHPRQLESAIRVRRLLVGVLAAALMARMVLNGRIYHYGFFEAAMAGVLVTAVLIGELPKSLGLGAFGRRVAVMGVLLLLGSGVAVIAGESQAMLRTKTYAIGSGADRFYTFPPQTLATGDIVRVMSEWLRRMPRGQTAVVLPEGEMINYLGRMPSPVAPYAFFGAATSNGREDRMVEDLARHPPDWIVLVSRDLRENGVQNYGESVGEGLDILNWVADNYRPVMSVGGDPLDNSQCGGVVFRRKKESRK